jgi:hypothetical protein
MNRKQLVVAWSMAIIISLLAVYSPRSLRYGVIGFSWGLFLPWTIPTLTIGGLLIYSLRNEKAGVKFVNWMKKRFQNILVIIGVLIFITLFLYIISLSPSNKSLTPQIEKRKLDLDKLPDKPIVSDKKK